MNVKILIVGIMVACIVIVGLLLANAPTATAQPAQGDWTITGEEVVENENIVLDGNLIVKSGGSLTLRNTTLRMNVQYDGQYGISVECEGSLFIYDSNMISNSEYGFTFHADSSNLVIKNSELRTLTGEGLAITNTDYAVIENNTILVTSQGESESCIMMYRCQHSMLKNNRISLYPPLSDVPLLYTSISGGICFIRSHNNTITGNHISDTQDGFNLAYSWNNRITNNTWIGPIGVADLQELAPRWWSVSTTELRGEGGVWLGPWSNNNIVENNTMFLCGTAIAVIHQSSNNRFANNTIKGAGKGIVLRWGSNNIIDNNDVSDVWEFDAVHVYCAHNNFIINNRISSAVGGIGLFTSDNNTVHGNTISDSGRGVFLFDSFGNSIVNNEVSTSIMPIVVADSSNNIIHRNNFVENIYRGYDNGDNDNWGNYWEEAIGAPYAIPPKGVDQQPSNVHVPISSVQAPELELLPFEEVPHRESLIEDQRVWQNQTIILKEGATIQNGGSLTLENVTLIFAPEEVALTFSRVNPLSITVKSGGSLFIYNSKIIGPEWGALGGFQIVVYEDSTFVIRDSEVRNGGYGWGSGAVAMEEGASGAIIENNTFTRTYCAISVEQSYNTRVINNTISNSVIGINVLGNENITVTGNKISKIAYQGIVEDAPFIPIINNTICDVWGEGILPCHWGIILENNSFSNVRGPSVLFQHPMIFAYNHGFRAFSFDSANVEAGQEITVFVRLAHTKATLDFPPEPPFPQTIDELLSLPHAVRLRVNGEIIDSKLVTLALGESATVELTGVAREAGTYDIVVEPAGVFKITDLHIDPIEAQPGQTVSIGVEVSNEGEVECSYNVVLKVGDEVVDNKEVTLEAGKSTTINFAVVKEAGSYDVDVEGQTGTLVVKVISGEGAPPAEGIPIVYVVVGVVATVAAIGLAFALKRR